MFIGQILSLSLSLKERNSMLRFEKGTFLFFFHLDVMENITKRENFYFLFSHFSSHVRNVL